jgi:hypothetical protein
MTKFSVESGTAMERMRTYDEIRASFRWNIPARYNIAADVCDRKRQPAKKHANRCLEEAGH